ncbi:Nif3-like dinuclear metal center hexameric protein [Idiomarina sp. UBA4520]|jgi:dinuclear metal center YbgI/SA1388 family protein|uniref:Nif3-like dinuclear metal center hexameric protein n=1 Tax=Idiomarina sp. UBA4520 TaxID=1946647 RepID=UPI000C69C740|nr:Nif3-like dinuclear metal center hexameric protein [Idiomarina sp. UBA4520]MBF38716.1 Nif3-like dinuclear metal center hexameric protein [Idiomarinaceae bacterium]|tara:strand:+ start:16068 stop:16829 length:762 start_codon:yes stop_codon:yes gene_type:complete
MTIKRSELHHYLNSYLNSGAIKDYCPNGLQVEGSEFIGKVITGVTACQALIDRAVDEQADAILVHHGYFWKGEPEPITGMKKARIKQLLKHDINLFAYHLPLDVHPEVGNNAQLAKLMGWQMEGPVDANDPACPLVMGSLKESVTGQLLANELEQKLQRPLTCWVEPIRPIQKLAWCTGGGQGFIDRAAALGVDAFITGEVSEPTIHSAREQGIGFYAAGHHATERYGAKALGEHIAQKFSLDVQFIDIDSPA